ncbi:hypothetical protein BKK49_12470 [Rodentibacter rarus]|nr:hypothetical protein BKK49_12470 [Rodentibacter rarus]
MKDKNVYTFGVIIALFFIMLYHRYINVSIIYKVLIDILILYFIPILYQKTYYYIIKLYGSIFNKNN